jgi:hypothetical protein
MKFIIHQFYKNWCIEGSETVVVDRKQRVCTELRRKPSVTLPQDAIRHVCHAWGLVRTSTEQELQIEGRLVALPGIEPGFED